MKHNFEKQVFHEAITTHEPINGVKVYRAIVSQSGTSAPVATVLENSLGGTPVWGYSDVGDYTLTLSEAFPSNKTLLFVGKKLSSHFSFQRVSDDICFLSSENSTLDPTSSRLANGRLSGTSIEIRVYP
jgi:hypothetical protein